MGVLYNILLSVTVIVCAGVRAVLLAVICLTPFSHSYCELPCRCCRFDDNACNNLTPSVLQDLDK